MMPESLEGPGAMPIRILGKSGLRVSELCLGAMTFGTDWGFGADEQACAEIYTVFREAGGNFIDTADVYTNGASEEMLGRFVSAERDNVVVSTKYTLPTDKSDPNSGGSHRKSLRRSVETSLARIGTDYLDLLWVHAWDQCTSTEETLRGLDDLVRSGKVLSIGVTNTPAWVVARSDAIAEMRGWTAFCALQVEYSLLARTPERELLPMASDLGISVCAWSPLARGLLTGKEPKGAARLSSAGEATVAVVKRIAAEVCVTPAQIALAWVMSRGVMPSLGARTVAQLRDNLGTLAIRLEHEHLEQLDTASRIRLGYPHEFLHDRRALFTPPTQKGPKDIGQD